MQFFLLKHGESRLIEIKEADKEEPAQNGDVHPDDTIENGHCSEEKKDDDVDQDVLQQLCDQFVESQPEAEQEHHEEEHHSD